MIRVKEPRSHFSPENLTSILDNNVPERMGEDAFNDLCFHPPWVQSFVCFALPMNPLGFSRSSWTIFAECESSKTPRWSQLIRAERSSNGSWRSHRALAGRRALEPMEIFSSVQRRARSTPLRDGDSDTRRPCWTLSLRFLRAFPLFFGPIYGLCSAVSHYLGNPYVLV